jgi:hypothetical protein
MAAIASPTMLFPASLSQQRMPMLSVPGGEFIRAALPASANSSWLGKRPPVDGDWIKTLDDEFNGTSLDPSSGAFTARTTGTRRATGAMTM